MTDSSRDIIEIIRQGSRRLSCRRELPGPDPPEKSNPATLPACGVRNYVPSIADYEGDRETLGLATRLVNCVCRRRT